MIGLNLIQGILNRGGGLKRDRQVFQLLQAVGYGMGGYGKISCNGSVELGRISGGYHMNAPD